jgi:hypothetical protein
VRKVFRHQFGGSVAGGKPINTVCYLVKTCRTCQTEKPIAEFSKSTEKFDGHNTRCKTCERLRHKRDYQNRFPIIQADNKRRSREDRLAAMRHYCSGEPHCQCCGESNIEFLTFDHVEGGGRQHRKDIGGNFYGWLRRQGYPEGFRVLCFNCNCSLGHYGYCPHGNVIGPKRMEKPRVIQWATPANGGILKGA